MLPNFEKSVKCGNVRKIFENAIRLGLLLENKVFALGSFKHQSCDSLASVYAYVHKYIYIYIYPEYTLYDHPS